MMCCVICHGVRSHSDEEVCAACIGGIEERIAAVRAAKRERGEIPVNPRVYEMRHVEMNRPARVMRKVGAA